MAVDGAFNCFEASIPQINSSKQDNFSAVETYFDPLDNVNTDAVATFLWTLLVVDSQSTQSFCGVIQGNRSLSLFIVPRHPIGALLCERSSCDD